MQSIITTPISGTIHQLFGEELLLMPQKAIFWKAKNILIISDLHLGKAAHFRKHGLAVPMEVGMANFIDLDQLLKLTNPSEVIILGDLFHSKHNKEWEMFVQWRCQNAAIKFHLVMGNHDILKSESYIACNLILHQTTLFINPFVFSHEPLFANEKGYNLAGHIHPSVNVSGKGRQKMNFKCFYFAEKYGLLPAFGNFTGTFCVQPTKKDDVFLILENSVVKM